MAYIGKEPIVGNFQKCDAITVVNGQAAYTLQVSSTNVVPESANHMLVSLNGILQAPVTSFTVSGSTLTFASNLATGDVIDFVILLGNVLDLGTPSDGTVTNAKLAQDIISGETALAAIPDTTDELLISDAGVLKRIDAQYFKNVPAFRATQTGSAQSLANTTNVVIALNSEIVDVGGCFNNTSGSVTLNGISVAAYNFLPNVAGTYAFNFGGEIDRGDEIDRCQVELAKNGTAVGRLTNHSATGVNAVQGWSGSCIATANGSSDTFSLRVYHDFGSSVDNEPSIGTYLEGYLLIGA